VYVSLVQKIHFEHLLQNWPGYLEALFHVSMSPQHVRAKVISKQVI